MISGNDIRLAYNLLRHKCFGRRFPAHVALAVTNNCNLGCPYCFYAYNLYKEDPVSTEQMLALIDGLHRRGTAYINLNGGEPLLRKDIGRVIDHIRLRRGMRCSLSTNATVLEHRIEDLRNLNIIAVSLDGNEEQHLKNRGDGNYKRALRGIEAARKRDMTVATCTVLTKDNKSCVEEMIRLGKELGVFTIFHFLYERLNASDVPANALNRDEETEIMDILLNYKRRGGYKIHYSARVHEYIRAWPLKDRRILRHDDRIDESKFRVIPCVAGDLFCFIDASGSVWPCSVLAGQVKALSVQDGFEKAWDEVPKHRCRSCSFFHQAEMNLLLSLAPGGWLDLIRSRFVRAGSA